MTNISRRKRQANANAKIIIEKFHNSIREETNLCDINDIITIDSEKKLMSVIDCVEKEVQSIAQSIEPDWAIPIVVEIIGELYYGDFKQYQQYGTTFKRSLVYLWNTEFIAHGDRKNINLLVSLLQRCFVVETLYSYVKMFYATTDFNFLFSRGYIEIPEKFMGKIMEFGAKIRGGGKRFRVADVNSKLMSSHFKDYIKGIINILDGDEPSSVNIFKGTFFESIPGIKDAECKKFWQELFLRYSLCLLASAQYQEGEKGCGVVFLHEFELHISEQYITQQSVFDIFWRKDWLKKQNPERYGNLIVDRPILRISPEGDFVTSLAIICDSINNFIEKQIFNYMSRNTNINLPQKIFKKAISEPFEQKCIEFFRSIGFQAGCVLESGVWKTQNGNISLNTQDKELYGEIDALAYHAQLKMVLLIECKVLHDVEDTRSYKNIIAKLRGDSEGYKSKLLKKNEWAKSAFALYLHEQIEPVPILLTDIPIPIIENDNNDVIYTYFSELKITIKKLIERYL